MTSRLRGAEQAWPDPWVHVFDYESGKEVECLKGHHGHVWDVAFAPDGATYCSGADDGMRSRCALLCLLLHCTAASAAYCSGADDRTMRSWQTDPSASKN